MINFIRKALPWIVLIASVILLLTIPSCSTTKTEYITETEYVPVYTDYTDVINPVILLKPNNSTYLIKTGNLGIFDVIDNSGKYLQAWQDWQLYANALELTLLDIRDTNLSKIKEKEP